MDEQTASALARRLAAYSATVGVALTAASAASAQVVYVDVEPDVTFSRLSQGDFDLDFDGDGTPDLRFRGDFDYGSDWVTFQLRRWLDQNPSNGPLGYNNYKCNNLVSVLASGDAVGPVAPDRDFVDNRWLVKMAYGTFYESCSPWVNRDAYAGFRFVAGDGQIHYGWARLSVSRPPFVETLYDYAYEATPEATIVAGDTDSAIALSGSVNQDSFPPEGGTLVFTATVTNTTAAPAPLDLWIEVGRNGVLGGRQLLGSGPVPAGATVTRAVAVGVAATAPAGTFDVTFKLGDYRPRAVLEAEQFVITKAAGAVAPSAAALADDGGLVVVEPVAGDLFAVAEAASPVVPSTHALSTPSPNPSDGRAALTLEVAEAQAVRVEVLDALGRRVAVLHDGVLASGAAHRLAFDGSSLPSGVYAVRVVGETFSDVRTVTLLR
jgi:hypothetical protein